MRQRNNYWKRRGAALLVLIAALALTACAAGSGGEVGPAIDLLDGGTVHPADYEGEVVVVNFWATWCGPCRVEMPELQAYYDAHQGDPGFDMLLVNNGETAETARAYIEEFGYTIPVGLDPDGEVGAYFGGVRGMPTTFVLNRAGEVVFEHAGPLNREVLEEEVTPLLEEG